MELHHTIDTQKLGADAEKALRGPIGAASPLWWAFAGAASAGVAYWWLTRWARPVNLEAMAPDDPALVEAAATYELQPDAIAEALEPEPELQAAPEAEAVATAPAAVLAEALAEELEEVAEAAAQVIDEIGADDLTVIVGIGPKLSASLAERGYTRLADIAAWTDEDIARLDRELKLMGRIGRQAWIDQARSLARG